MLFMISLFCVLAFLCILFKKRFEQLLAPFVCVLMLIAYALAMFQGLRWLCWITYAGAALGIIWVVSHSIRGRAAWLRLTVQYFFTPGQLCFIILVVVYCLGSQSHIVTATDDIYYWAIEARSIFAHHGLVDAARHLSPRFMTYTPGMQLFQWLGLTVLGEWNEGTAYCMQWIFYAVFLLPFAKGITWKKAYAIPVFILLVLGLPTIMNGDAYTMLRVDTAHGICLGYALTQAWSLRKQNAATPFQLVCFSLSLCALVLIKQIGAAWALMAVALLAFVVKPLKAGTVKTVWVALACTAPFAIFGSWIIFSSAKGLRGAHLDYAAYYLEQIVKGTWIAPINFNEMPGAIWKVLSQTSQSLLPERAGRWIDIPKIAWVGLFSLLPLALIPVSREKQRTLTSLLGCNWQSVHDHFILQWQGANDDTFSIEKMENFWIDDLENPTDTIILYGVEHFPFKLEKIQYIVAPAKLVLTTKEDLTQEAFIKLLQDCQITHIVCMDESNPIYKNAMSLVDDEWLDVLTPYRLAWEGDVPFLEPEQPW